MPALPVIPKTFRVAFDWIESGTGQHAVNVTHWYATASGGATPAQVYNCLNAHVADTMFNSVTDTAGVSTVAVTELDGVSATQEFVTGLPSKWKGLTPGSFVPSSATVMKIATGTRGRSYRGRVFLPFLPEGSMANGQLTGTTASDMTTAWNTFVAACAADATTPLELGVASYKLAVFTGGETFTVEQFIATQRRRQSRIRS